jgi:hypothetical protein
MDKYQGPFAGSPRYLSLKSSKEIAEDKRGGQNHPEGPTAAVAPRKLVHGAVPAIHEALEDASSGLLTTLRHRQGSLVIKPDDVSRVVGRSWYHTW